MSDHLQMRRETARALCTSAIHFYETADIVPLGDLIDDLATLDGIAVRDLLLAQAQLSAFLVTAGAHLAGQQPLEYLSGFVTRLNALEAATVGADIYQGGEIRERLTDPGV